MNFKYLVSSNPFAWVYVEYAPGKRVLKEMLDFDCNRSDVQVNRYGVVHFYNTDLAKLAMEKFKRC